MNYIDKVFMWNRVERFQTGVLFNKKIKHDLTKVNHTKLFQCIFNDCIASKLKNEEKLKNNH